MALKDVMWTVLLYLVCASYNVLAVPYFHLWQLILFVSPRKITPNFVANDRLRFSVQLTDTYIVSPLSSCMLLDAFAYNLCCRPHYNHATRFCRRIIRHAFLNSRGNVADNSQLETLSSPALSETPSK